MTHATNPRRGRARAPGASSPRSAAPAARRSSGWRIDSSVTAADPGIGKPQHPARAAFTSCTRPSPSSTSTPSTMPREDGLHARPIAREIPQAAPSSTGPTPSSDARHAPELVVVRSPTGGRVKSPAAYVGGVGDRATRRASGTETPRRTPAPRRRRARRPDRVRGIPIGAAANVRRGTARRTTRRLYGARPTPCRVLGLDVALTRRARPTPCRRASTTSGRSACSRASSAGWGSAHESPRTRRRPR